MNLKANIQFYVNGPLVSNKVRNIYDLQTIVQTCDLTEPRHLTLTCRVNVVNDTKQTRHKPSILDLITTDPNSKEVARFTFTAADKVTTVADIRAFLNNKYGTTFNFEPYENTEHKPAILDYVHENNCTGLVDSKTGRPTHYTIYTVQWHYLNKQDIIVDKDLKQIWPHRTGKAPVAIQKFFHVHVR